MKEESTHKDIDEITLTNEHPNLQNLHIRGEDAIKYKKNTFTKNNLAGEEFGKLLQ